MHHFIHKKNKKKEEKRDFVSTHQKNKNKLGLGDGKIPELQSSTDNKGQDTNLPVQLHLSHLMIRALLANCRIYLLISFKLCCNPPMVVHHACHQGELERFNIQGFNNA
jgi:hypothetical protein